MFNSVLCDITVNGKNFSNYLKSIGVNNSYHEIDNLNKLKELSVQKDGIVIVQLTSDCEIDDRYCDYILTAFMSETDKDFKRRYYGYNTLYCPSYGRESESDIYISISGTLCPEPTFNIYKGENTLNIECECSLCKKKLMSKDAYIGKAILCMDCISYFGN